MYVTGYYSGLTYLLDKIKHVRMEMKKFDINVPGFTENIDKKFGINI